MAASGRPKGTRESRGLEASSPTQMGWRAWKEILGRVWVKSGEDNISLLAAGVAFYAFLTIAPLLAALILTYGLVADPATVATHMRTVIDLVPREAAELIYEQLLSVTTAASGKTGLGLLLAILISLYGAMRAAGAIITALNVIYEQKERRNIIKTTLLSAGMTVGAVIVGILGIVTASVLGFLQELVGGWLGPLAIGAIKGATWLAAGVFASAAIAAAYRYGPDRRDARWSWLSLGSALATLLWLLATLGFGFYAAKFGDYNATYGSLGAVVVLLMWLFVSAYAVLLGASINAETERQTLRDTTKGGPRPMGSRGATVADHGPDDDTRPEAGQDRSTLGDTLAKS